jgi:hypothetical protein
MTSLINKIVSSEVNVDLLSNIKKESMRGFKKLGIVSGKF